MDAGARERYSMPLKSAYIAGIAVLIIWQDYGPPMETYREILIIDPSCASALRGMQRVEKLMNGDDVDESMDVDDQADTADEVENDDQDE
eukprot:SAG31_NODE_5186_length_2693_cov_1.525443_4_plen_90_part_00